MTSTDSPARRLANETCRRFLETCGWPLRFRPIDEPTEDGNGTERLWRRDLSDGRSRVGELILDLPEDERLDAEFLQMTKAAELIAGLLEEALAAHAAAEASRGEVETLARIGSSVPRQADLSSALNQLLRAVTQLTSFRAVAFFLLDPGGERLTLRLKHEAHSADVPCRDRVIEPDAPDLAALAGRTVILRRSVQPVAAGWLPGGMSTAVCLPVFSEQSPIGTLWAFDRRDRQPETRELHVLESIASQLASVLERAVLVRESESEKRLRRHLQAALETQPGRVLSEPGPDCGFESAGVCRSALDIGGDLVELVPLDKRRTLVAIGDATGDGVPAAMVMANVRGALRALALATLARSAATDQVVAGVNRALCGITPPHLFMSLLLGVYDGKERRFVYTNAGHPSPLHVRGASVTELASHGMLLGVLEDTTYERSALALAPGDLLVLFTDGVSEAMGRDQRMFRSDGVAGAVRSAAGHSPREIVEAVWSRLASHVRGAGGGDDRSLLVLRVK
jgi:sigma-B regulation protein RsbU (phosphoserine phosphatase)